MIFDRLLGLFSHDLAIDLGTATTLVYVKGAVSYTHLTLPTIYSV